MGKFKVGDRIKYNDYYGYVVEEPGINHNEYLCKLDNFIGHNGGSITNSGVNYNTNDHLYCWEEYLRKVEKVDNNLSNTIEHLKGVYGVSPITIGSKQAMSRILTSDNTESLLSWTVPNKSCIDAIKLDNMEAKTNMTNRRLLRERGYKRDIKDTTIVDYEIINNKVVIVTFYDKTTQKAVCDDEDSFDFEKAIQICVLKHELGSSRFNNLVTNAVKDANDITMAKYEEELKKERHEKYMAKRATYKARRAERKRQAELEAKEKERQEQVNIQAEAYLLAMRMHEAEKSK